MTANVGVIREKMQIAYNHLRKRLDHSIEMQNDLKEDITEVQQSIEDVKEDTEVGFACRGLRNAFADQH